MSFALRSLVRERAFALALVSAIVVLLFGRTLLHGLTINWWTGALFLWLFATVLVSAFAVVRHAESLAHHYGEPYGTLILTLSAVAIEVIMISAMMLNEDPDPTLGRDTIYATLMIIVSGLILFLRIQTKEHRYYFVSEPSAGARPAGDAGDGAPGWYHVVLLLGMLSLIGYLAESVALIIDASVDQLELPIEVASLLVALLLLAPESLTALRAGLDNDMQRVVNICLGSALSTVSLTIPAVLLVGILTGQPVITRAHPRAGRHAGLHAPDRNEQLSERRDQCAPGRHPLRAVRDLHRPDRVAGLVLSDSPV